MLEVGFALPVLDAIHAEYILYFFADLGLGIIADQYVHGSPFPDLVTEHLEELGIALTSMRIQELGLCTSEQLSMG